MFNSIKNKFVKNNTYDDISILYDIVDIYDNYILVKRDNILKQIHIYKIEPVTILNVTNHISNNILGVYTEFLRSVNADFQIYIENSKININDYFENIVIDEENNNKSKLARTYKKELDDYLNENSIYTLNYYIIIEIDQNNHLEQLNKDMSNLVQTGIIIEKLEGKEGLEKFIYTKVNKVDNIC